MKRLTGESMLKARKLYQNFEEFRNVTTLWMAANDLPQVDAFDDAMWRRIRLIPFTTVIPEARRDPMLLRSLVEDRDAVLTWAVQGCLAWQEEGLELPAAVAEATACYRADSNPLTDWIEDRCEPVDGALVSAAELRRDYEDWCSARRITKIPRGGKWKASLERLGCSQPDDARGRATIDGVQVVAWQGITLRARS